MTYINLYCIKIAFSTYFYSKIKKCDHVRKVIKVKHKRSLVGMYNL